ncbi:ABC transporter substrate-binding protein [Chloroflexota bacterium]
MTRKIILIMVTFMLVLSACAPSEAPISEPDSPIKGIEEGIVEPTPYPDVEKTDVNQIVEEPTPYPDVDQTVAEQLLEEPIPYPDVDQTIVELLVEDSTPYPGPEEVEWPLVIIDDLGNTIKLMAYPQAIISLSPSTTEILFAVGAGDQVVGRDDLSVYPEAALEVESIGSLWDGVPTETILAAEPDLVVAAEIISEENVQVLIDLGVPVYWQANPTDFDGLYENLQKFGDLTGHTDETELLVSDLQARVEAVVETISGAKDAPRVFYELDATDPANPWTTGSGTFIDYIILMAGGMNAAEALQGEYTQISAEELIAVNPEIILLSDALYGVSPESVAERPGWNAIAAVMNGAVFPIDPNMMSVPGPRLVDALEETAKIIHPELFE